MVSKTEELMSFEMVSNEEICCATTSLPLNQSCFKVKSNPNRSSDVAQVSHVPTLSCEDTLIHQVFLKYIVFKNLFSLDPTHFSLCWISPPGSIQFIEIDKDLGDPVPTFAVPSVV